MLSGLVLSTNERNLITEIAHDASADNKYNDNL